MGKLLTHKEFLDKLVKNNSSYREGIFSVISPYKRALSKIKVNTKYGDCLVEANSLVRGYKPTISTAVDKDRFFEAQSKEIHGDEFNYEKVKYTNNDTPITIICSIHGDFNMLPKEHLIGSKCPKCARNNSGFSFQKWSNFNKDNQALLYVLNCFNENENFIKIGITTSSVENRYKGVRRMPYKYTVVKEMKVSRELIWQTEKQIKKEITTLYNPLLKFKGSVTECFETTELDNILKIIEWNESTQ